MKKSRGRRCTSKSCQSVVGSRVLFVHGYCQACWAVLPHEQRETICAAYGCKTVCGDPISRTCPQCSGTIRPKAQFCHVCGWPEYGKAKAAVIPTARTNWGSILVPIGIFLVFSFLLFLAFKCVK